MNARGWTPTLIDRHLGEPDRLMRNPHYRSAAPMRGYEIARVKKAEERDDVRAALAKVLAQRANRSSGALKAAETRRRQMREWPEPDTIFWYLETPTTVEEAEKLAIAWWAEREKTRNSRTVDMSSLSTRGRKQLTRRYLAKKWIDYRETLQTCPRILEDGTGLEIIEDRIDQMMDQRFPELAGNR